MLIHIWTRNYAFFKLILQGKRWVKFGLPKSSIWATHEQQLGCPRFTDELPMSKKWASQYLSTDELDKSGI